MIDSKILKDADPSIREDSSNYYNGNPNLKKAGVITPYTTAQLMEIARCAADPIYFIENYVKIVSLDKGLTQFTPYDYQTKTIKHINDNRFSIIMMPRQMGKCVEKSTKITVRNKKTGEEKEIEIGEFFSSVQV